MKHQHIACRLLGLTLALAAMIGLFTCTVFAEDIPTSGTCGNDATWSINEDTLTICGTGSMEDYTGEVPAPWISCHNHHQDHR